jgi:hypothetical protein
MSQFDANLIAPTPYLSTQPQAPMEHGFIEDVMGCFTDATRTKFSRTIKDNMA